MKRNFFMSIALMTALICAAGCGKSVETESPFVDVEEEIVVAIPTEKEDSNIEGLMEEEETVEEPVEEPQGTDEIIDATPSEENEFEYESHGVKIWVSGVPEGESYRKLSINEIVVKTLDGNGFDDGENNTICYWGENNGIYYYMSADDFVASREAYKKESQELRESTFQEVDETVEALPIPLQSFAEKKGAIWVTINEDIVNGQYSQGIANGLTEMPNMLAYAVNKCIAYKGISSVEYIYTSVDGDEEDDELPLYIHVILKMDGEYYNASFVREGLIGAVVYPTDKETVEDIYGITL